MVTLMGRVATSTGELMQEHSGQCHCGGVRFKVRTNLDVVFRCNCSFCRRRGAVMHKIMPEQFELLGGDENLTVYQWHTQTAKHHFCRHCGIYTHHRPRSAPDMIAINVGCLKNVALDELEIGGTDGASFD